MSFVLQVSYVYLLNLNVDKIIKIKLLFLSQKKSLNKMKFMGNIVWYDNILGGKFERISLCSTIHTYSCSNKSKREIANNSQSG